MSTLLERIQERRERIRRRLMSTQEIPEIEIPPEFRRIPPELEEPFKRMARYKPPASARPRKPELSSASKVRTY